MTTQKRRIGPSTEELLAASSELPAIERLAGTTLMDRYRLLDLLGQGGAAVVYRAEHTMMHKTVAVKILRPEITAQPTFVRRFLSEARTVAKLRHEGIVDMVDIGRTESGTVFCVMEWLDGEDLSVMLAREGKLPWPRAKAIVLQLCDALIAVHEAGIVHRDIKPQNCFCVTTRSGEERIKLLDFGISKDLETDRKFTATGLIMGTAGYMPPEQARGSAVDVRADVYAVGAVLFELVTGRPAYEGATFVDTLLLQISQAPPRVSTFEPDAPGDLDQVIRRALRPDPDDRFGSMQALRDAVEGIPEDPRGAHTVVVPVPVASDTSDPNEGSDRDSGAIIEPGESMVTQRSAPIVIDGPRSSSPTRSTKGARTLAAISATVGFSMVIAAVGVAQLFPEDDAPGSGEVVARQHPEIEALGRSSRSAEPQLDPRVAAMEPELGIPTPSTASPHEPREEERVADQEPETDARTVDATEAEVRDDPPTKNHARSRSEVAPAAPSVARTPPPAPPASKPPPAPEPAGIDRRQLQRKLAAACEAEVGRTPRQARVRTDAHGRATIEVIPPRAPLVECVQRTVNRLRLTADTHYTISLQPARTRQQFSPFAD